MNSFLPTVHDLLHHIWHALEMSFSMGWAMFWALTLGFTISAVVQAVVKKSEMSKWLADDSAKSISIATLCGMASSSCSYAAVAIARSLIKQGADFTAAMAFQFASTNLVLELGILLALMLGWQFTAAEFVGGTMMIIIMSLIFRIFFSGILPKDFVQSAKEKASKDVVRSMAGHVDNNGGSTSGGEGNAALTAISHYFFMDWFTLGKDILFGLLIAGMLCAWVPESFWTILLCKGDTTAAHWLNPLIGPLIAIFAFVCSIGNVPMAAVLWQSGMTFGGVISFLFADLLIFPLLNIYRKYYGLPMAVFLFVSFYISMVLAAYGCEWLFGVLGLIPQNRFVAGLANATGNMVGDHGIISWNYTTVLNIVAFVFTALLFVRFYQTGGLKILTAKDHCCH